MNYKKMAWEARKGIRFDFIQNISFNITKSLFFVNTKISMETDPKNLNNGDKLSLILK
jgi:hypothetical protein